MVSLHALGSFGAERDGAPVPLGGRRQRSVLALLVSARGRVVSVDRMIEELWQGAPPAQAVTSLQAYVSNLRRLLEPGRAPRATSKLLVSAPPGYALRLPDDAVDAWRFERLLGEARDAAAREPETARRLLADALALWQGPAYAEFADDTWARPEITRLDELRSVAREQSVAAALRVGDLAAAVPEAELLTGDEPLREEAWRLHALALWAAGRQADALAALRRARTVLADEVGLDPGPALTGLEAAILGQDTRLLDAATAATRREPVRASEPASALPSEPASPLPFEPGSPVPAADASPTSAQPTDPTDPTAPTAPTAPTDPQALFVGRDAELGLLMAAAARAPVSGPSIALVTGEAGQGKSALLERFGDRLRAGGWLVAVGRNTDAEGAPPAWAWVEALRTVAASVPPPPEAADVLAPLLADAASQAGVVEHADPAVGRFRLHRAVWQWLAAVARERPVAVLVDDLHWADAETIGLLTGLLDVAAGTPILVVAAYRPDETDGRLAEGLAALARRSPLRVPLPGLPREAVARVIEAAGVPPQDAVTVAALAERTGGNPFYVRESARLLGSEGALVALSEVPEGVRDVLRRRLGRLPELAVAVLRLAAVVGREADVEVLLGAADTGEDAVLGALETGLVAGLLVEPRPGRVRFGHALVRDTLLADLSLLRSTRMHARIAAALEALGSDDVSALAHHYARSASSATAAKAVDHCVRAADLAEARFAHAAAADLLGDALECFARIPADGSGDREADGIALLGRLLRAQVRAGAITAARATRQRAIDRAVAADRDDLLIRAFTAWTETSPWQSRPYGTVDGPVVAHLERLLGLPGLAPAYRCRLLDAFCAELSDLRDPRVRAAAEEAVTLTEGLDDPSLRAQVLAKLARELDSDRETREHAEIGRELERLGAAHELPVYRWFGVFSQASAAAVAGDVAGAYRHIAASMELARAYRMPEPLTVGETALATLAHIEGRHEDAELLYDRAAAGMARAGSPHAEGFRLVAVATIRVGQGRLGEFVPQARWLYEAFGPVFADLLAAALAADGQRDEARTVLARVGPLPTDYFFKVYATFRAMAMTGLGETKGAEELYAALLPYRDAPPPSSGFTVAIRPMAATLAELAALLGRDEEAIAHAAHAAAIAGRWSRGSSAAEARTA